MNPRFPTVRIENSNLAADIYEDRPVVAAYSHVLGGDVFTGAGREGVLSINGRNIPWDEWKIARNKTAQLVQYDLELSQAKIGITFDFSVEADALVLRLSRIEDPDSRLHRIEWIDLPLLYCTSGDYRYWRVRTEAPEANGKMWMREECGSVGSPRGTSQSTGDEVAEGVPVIWGCLWNAKTVCAFVDTNYPLFPTLHRSPGLSYSVSINGYQYRVRSTLMPPLEARVVFLGDENGDGVVDDNDYRLWLNRRIPDPPDVHKSHITYRILNDWIDQGGVLTDLEQSEEIVRSIYHVTDGLPQIPYLTGWQYTGHDTGYPAMARVNERIGGKDALWKMSSRCRDRYNATVSYHINIDDCYPGNPGYNERFCLENGISHTLDVESGEIFKRLSDLEKSVPVERIVRIDNMRITNTHTLRSIHNIGVLEELVCGIGPIMEWFAERGITAVTEGQNGLPVDASLMVQGLWHFDPVFPVIQIYHGKVTGGGRGNRSGPMTRMDALCVKGIHQDFTFEPWPEYPNIVSMQTDWDDIVDRIYRGTLLYHFYLEHEMTLIEKTEDGFRFEFDGGKIITDVSEKSASVTWGDLVIAIDNDRFIPRGGSIYCYSLTGCDRTWILPEAFRRKRLQLYELSRGGKKPITQFSISDDRIDFRLDPRTPVKISLPDPIYKPSPGGLHIA